MDSVQLPQRAERQHIRPINVPPLDLTCMQLQSDEEEEEDEEDDDATIVVEGDDQEVHRGYNDFHDNECHSDAYLQSVEYWRYATVPDDFWRHRSANFSLSFYPSATVYEL